MAKICQNEESPPAEEATLPVAIRPTLIIVNQVLSILEIHIVGITI